MTYRSRDTKLVESLINYVKDIKPYHVKLKNFTSELFFKDRFNLSVIDEYLTTNVYLQNVWTKDDIGGWYLSNVSDGAKVDRQFRLPPTVFPRFSTNGKTDQTPAGDDPALLQNALSTEWSYSHQTGSDVIPYEFDVTSFNVSITNVISNSGSHTVTYDVSIIAKENLALFGLNEVDVKVSHLNNASYPGVKFQEEIIHGYDVVDADDDLYDADTEVFVKWLATGLETTILDSQLRSYANLPNDVARISEYLNSRSIKIFVDGDTGRFKVPFHHGSQVYVDGFQKAFNYDYTVDLQHNAIQFLAGKHPSTNSKVTINYFNCDRLFIARADPFNWQVSRAYDMAGYDDTLYDTDDSGIIFGSDTYTLNIDTSYVGHYQPVEFFNTTPGTTKADMTQILVYPSQVTGNKWVMTATSYLTVSVQQVEPITGPIEYAQLNKPFDNGKIAFTLKAPWIPYYLIQDSNSYIAYEPVNPLLERTDFWVNLDIKTEHGLPNNTSSIQGPIRYNKIGMIRQREINTLQGKRPIYEFVFDNIPIRGTYIEFRVEQTRQYNPRVNATVKEIFNITELISFNDGCCTNATTYRGQYGQLLNGYDDEVYDMQYDSGPPLSILNILATGNYAPVPISTWNFEPIPNSTLLEDQPFTGWGTTNLSAVYDLKLFEPICTSTAFNINRSYDMAGYDDLPYDTAPFDFYAAVQDDFYLTVTMQDTSQVKILHHVTLHPSANFYQEPSIIDELTLQHSHGSNIAVDILYEGSILTTGFTILIEQYRIVIKLDTPMSIAVMIRQLT